MPGRFDSWFLFNCGKFHSNIQQPSHEEEKLRAFNNLTHKRVARLQRKDVTHPSVAAAWVATSFSDCIDCSTGGFDQKEGENPQTVQVPCRLVSQKSPYVIFLFLHSVHPLSTSLFCFCSNSQPKTHGLTALLSESKMGPYEYAEIQVQICCITV
jgi:hypothetical protein